MQKLYGFKASLSPNVTRFVTRFAQKGKFKQWLDIKATLLHYPGAPMAQLQIKPDLHSPESFLWPCKFMTVHYGVCGATVAH